MIGLKEMSKSYIAKAIVNSLIFLRNENLITSLSTQLSELHGNSILANIHQK